MAIQDDLRAVIGTLAHNRTFKPREIGEYTRFDRRIDSSAAMRWLRSKGYVTKVEGGYLPTRSGWEWIEGRGDA